MSNPDLVIEEEQQLSPFWGVAVKIGPAILVGLFYLTIVLHYAYTPDDTYIDLQYAGNLAHGDKFAFNADAPTYGTTAPLWVLLIAAGTKAGLDPFIVAKTFDILFASLSVIAVYVLSFSIIRDKVYSLFVTLVFSLDAFVLRWAGSGTETSIAMLLVLLAVKYAYAGDYHIAGFVAGLLTLVRPEGLFLFFVIQLENYIVSIVLGRNRTRFWAAAALYGLVVVPWLVFSYANFGSVIPNAILARMKMQSSLWNVGQGIFNSAIVLSSTLPLLILLLVVGVPLVIRKSGIGTFVAKGMPIVWIAGLVLGSQLVSTVGFSRLLVPAISLIVVYAFWCLRQMEDYYHWPRKKALLFLSILSCATILQSEFVYRLIEVPHMDALTEESDKGIRPIALWLRSNTKVDASVSAEHAGLLGYIGQRKILDGAGLFTPKTLNPLTSIERHDGTTRSGDREAEKFDFVVDRSIIRARLSSDSLRPVLTTEFGDPGSKISGLHYYTLYRVIR
ncbi:MAG TPA: hypothetical protein VI758_00705 [Bacteroidota bacterium]